MMDDSNDSSIRFDTLLKILQKVDSDSENFASLLIITKMVRADSLSQDERKQIFELLGFSFLLKLIVQHNTEGEIGHKTLEEKVMLQNLGFSVLSAYSTVTELLHTPELERAVSPAIKFVERFMKHSTTSEEDMIGITDCIQFLTAMATTVRGCKSIMAHDGICVLVKLFCIVDSEDVKNMLWSVLLNLINYDACVMWQENKENMLALLEHISYVAKLDKGEKKFQLVSQIHALLNTLSSTYADYYFKYPWIDHVTAVIWDVLCSKVGPAQRNPTLKLCGSLTEKYNLKWTCQHQPINKKLPILLVRLACVEIKLIVYETSQGGNSALSEQWNNEQISLLLACFAIFEKACSCIADFDHDKDSEETVFNFEDVENLTKPFEETIRLVVNDAMVTMMGIENMVEHLMACMRMVGSWLNIEFFAKSEAGLEIAAPVLRACKACFEVYPQDCIKTITPAIMHYTENPRTKDIMFKIGIVPILWRVLCEEDLEVSCEFKVLVSQCLMALCLETQNSELFSGALALLMEKALGMQKQNMVIYFYVITLALIIWNRCDNDTRKIPHQGRFFQKVVNLLHGIHAIKDSKIEVMKRYAAIWNEVDQLWFIIVRELVQAAQSCDDITSLVKNSGFPAKVNILLSYYCGDNSQEPATSYSLFGAYLLGLQ